MKESGNEIQVGTLDDHVCVRVEGKGTHLNSPSLREFLAGMIEGGYRHFRLDLGRCTYMDSTFLGMLVGVSLQLKRISPVRITILDANARGRELFQTLGIEQFFHFDNGSAPASRVCESELKSLTEANVSIETKAETMLAAHEALVKADERNVCRFKDVITFLKEDLDRIRAPKAGAPADKPRS
jgi:anti-anti-sigma factor